MLEPMEDRVPQQNEAFREISQQLEQASSYTLECSVENHDDSPDWLKIKNKNNGRIAYLVYDGRKNVITFYDGRVLTFPSTLEASDVELIVKNFEFSKAVGVEQ